MSGLLLGANQFSRIFIPGARVLGTGCQGTELCCVTGAEVLCDDQPTVFPAHHYITFSDDSTPGGFHTFRDLVVGATPACDAVYAGMPEGTMGLPLYWGLSPFMLPYFASQVELKSYKYERYGDPYNGGATIPGATDGWEQLYRLPGPFTTLPGYDQTTCGSLGGIAGWEGVRWNYNCTKVYNPRWCSYDLSTYLGSVTQKVIVDYYYTSFMLHEACGPLFRFRMYWQNVGLIRRYTNTSQDGIYEGLPWEDLIPWCGQAPGNVTCCVLINHEEVYNGDPNVDEVVGDTGITGRAGWITWPWSPNNPSNGYPTNNFVRGAVTQ